MRSMIAWAHAARRMLMRLLRWRTVGVKVMAFNPAGEILLVRHLYGRTDLFMLPGGGVDRGEPPAVAARRELIEETGCTLVTVTAIGIYAASAEGRRDTVHLFSGVTTDSPRVDGVELAEAAFFPLDALPPTLSPATRRRIEEHAGTRAATGVW